MAQYTHQTTPTLFVEADLPVLGPDEAPGLERRRTERRLLPYELQHYSNDIGAAGLCALFRLGSRKTIGSSTMARIPSTN
jgi:hypothetical protein